jgi:hypothetical protein
MKGTDCEDVEGSSQGFQVFEQNFSGRTVKIKNLNDKILF